MNGIFMEHAFITLIGYFRRSGGITLAQRHQSERRWTEQCLDSTRTFTPMHLRI
ncbi:MAG: hypothetical protein IAE67_00205 [Candidatus Competibacteraceae bacterium]|nr:hypothetical protein [Candidatus Competibacteraceae bacterium]